MEKLQAIVYVKAGWNSLLTLMCFISGRLKFFFSIEIQAP